MTQPVQVECLIANSANIARRKRRAMLLPEHGFTVGCTCGNDLCIEPEHLQIVKWKMYRPPKPENPRCPKCGGGSWAIFKGVTERFKRGVALSSRRQAYLCRDCSRTFYAGEFLRDKMQRWIEVVGLRPGCFWLGQFWGVSLARTDIPKQERCKAKGCAFPANGNGQGLCHHHFHFFDYSVSRLGRNLDMNDIYGDDKAAPLFYVTWFWKHQGERLKFEQGGKTSWWQERVTLVMESMKPVLRSDATANIQMPGGRKIFKGWGKKKIRKSQRKREAGWHGPRPDHDVVKRWSRETVEDTTPTWTPADKPSRSELEKQADEILSAAHFFDETPLATPVAYMVTEPDYDDEQEREELIAKIDNHEFEEIFAG